MAGPLYLIPMCPRGLQPISGDHVTVRLADLETGQRPELEIHLRSGVVLPCEHVTLDAAGVLVRFPPVPIAGTVSDVRVAPTGRKAAEVGPVLAGMDLLPEDVLIAVAPNRSIAA